jgi:deazaflavin-dependent oxidoreductase (nitroreductase family)
MIGLSKRLNPILTPFASRGLVGVLGVIVHTGRASGRSYTTPIAIRRRGDDFVIPLPYGETTDWCRNVVAAGEAVVRFHGADYRVRDPEIVGLAVADTAYDAFLRVALRVLGIRRFLLVRRVA